jgi:hypothetical protein
MHAQSTQCLELLIEDLVNIFLDQIERIENDNRRFLFLSTLTFFDS